MALLAPDPRRIADPPAQPPADDRVPDAVAAGTPEPLRADLVALLGERVLHRASDLVAYASDASPYRLIPKAVVMAHDAEDVRRVLDYGGDMGTPVTLRSGGTSLNGQGQGDGILVDVRRHFVGVEVLEDGAAVRCKPGTVLGHVNRVLALHGRKLGPDPASTEAATIGGVIANNSGGMRCGVAQDSYRTLRSMTFVLPSGTTIDTAAPDAEQRFAAAEPALADGLRAIREEILADRQLADRIRHKFRIKNTTGYRLIAFLDGETPLETFRRLLAGLPVWIPEDVAGHCCATPWTSKGFQDGGRFMAAKTAAALRRWSEDGRLPVITDASSCTHGFREHTGVDVLDAVEWVHDRLLPRLRVGRRVGSVAVHPTCSSKHLGLGPRLEALAAATAETVTVPAAAACCGYAGDRGLLHPELPAAATRDEASELESAAFGAYVSSNRTCELGMQQATGAPYRSVVHLLDEVTR